MIHWPAILKYNGDDELAHVPSKQVFEDDYAGVVFEQGDLLIDSSANVLDLSVASLKNLTPIATLSIPELVELTQKHAVVIGYCCSSKIGFNSVEEGVKVIGSLCD